MQADNSPRSEAENGIVIPISERRTKRRSQFVKTAAATQILNALSYTVNEDDLAVIYGAPGVGKTRTIQQFSEQAGRELNVWVTTVAPSISTVVPLLTAIALTVGVVDNGGGARTLHTNICRRFTSARRAILIIDEAQHLRKAALEELRAIHDATDTAVALVGNDEVYRRLAAHPQLHSRVGVRLRLPRPYELDVRTIVTSRWGTPDEDTLDLLDQISQLPGALRLVTKVMKAAPERTVKGVRAACKMLGVELGGAR